MDHGIRCYDYLQRACGSRSEYHEIPEDRGVFGNPLYRGAFHSAFWTSSMGPAHWMVSSRAPAPAIDTILPVTSQQKVGAPIEAGGKNVGSSSNLSVPRCSDALRRIKISRAQMLASGPGSPSMVGISSETVGWMWAVERLLKGKVAAAGAYAPGEIFDAKHFLADIDPEYSSFEVTESSISSREEQGAKAS